MSTHAIVLAAGQGTRMRSDVAKVLHEAGGRSLLDWVLSALEEIELESVVVVVGHQARSVTAALADHELAPLIATASQAEQLGTGHAAAIGLAALNAAADDVVIVLPGDAPLIKPASLHALVDQHRASGAEATVVAAIVDDPAGYGRIKRSGGSVVAIVEQADATPEEAGINEVNTSVYAFTASALAANLALLGADNAQGEMYLTDVIGLMSAQGRHVTTIAIDPAEAAGVNTPEQLERVAIELAKRIAP